MKQLFIYIALIVLCGNLAAQKTFTKEFKHGENDKFHGRIFYQLTLEQGGQIIPSDSRSLHIIPEKINEEVRVNLVITKADLAYKKSTFESKSQDKEPEVFIIEFSPIANPSYGITESVASPKIFDQSVDIGANSTKAIIRFTCNNTTPVNSAINFSFKVIFSPRGKSGVTDSPVVTVNIPVKIDAPADVYKAELRYNEAAEEYKYLYQSLSQDPKRKNIDLLNKIKVFVEKYKDIKNPGVQQMQKAIKEYETRKDGPEDVYLRIKNFQNAVMLQNASGDINKYIENCVQGIWSDCSHLEEVRYLQIANSKFDTTLITNFFKVYRQSRFRAELIEERQKARDRKKSGGRSSGGGNRISGNGYSGSSGGNSNAELTSEENMELEEASMDSIVIENEEAGVNIRYNKVLRRIDIEKTGDWESVNYFFELVGNAGKQGMRAMKPRKTETIYVDDLDYGNDSYTFNVYKRSGNDKHQIIDNSVQFIIEKETFDKNIFLYIGFLLVFGILYFLYTKYIKI